jgi:hypothetical protein
MVVYRFKLQSLILLTEAEKAEQGQFTAPLGVDLY